MIGAEIQHLDRERRTAPEEHLLYLFVRRKDFIHNAGWPSAGDLDIGTPEDSPRIGPFEDEKLVRHSKRVIPSSLQKGSVKAVSAQRHLERVLALGRLDRVVGSARVSDRVHEIDQTSRKHRGKGMLTGERDSGPCGRDSVAAPSGHLGRPEGDERVRQECRVGLGPREFDRAFGECDRIVVAVEHGEPRELKLRFCQVPARPQRLKEVDPPADVGDPRAIAAHCAPHA